jgi:flagellar basal-body rod modification protein FlgD
MTTNPVTLNNGTGSSNNNSSSSSPTDPLANESTFLQLLVSQLQNQDPLNPLDSTQFVSQLTSYSQLEQLININHNTAGLAPASSGTTPPDSGTTPSN